MSQNQNPFKDEINLAQPRLGARVVYATDEFFGAKERMIEPKPAVFIEDKYDDHGKWMDGWESRRKRVAGHDYAVLKLGVTGVIAGLDIDTSHFTGNFPPAASIEGCVSEAEIPEEQDWVEICPKTDLEGNAHHYLPVNHPSQFTHLRLHIYPDGGIARLRVFGTVQPRWSEFANDDLLDLLAVENGGRALVCNDEHFGSMHNLNAPGRGVNMGDGWETARRRTPGNDWVVMALGHAGVISEIEVDTAHFKGNYPDRVSIQAAYFPDATPDLDPRTTEAWQTLLPETKLEMDQQHYFEVIRKEFGPVSHIRMNIYPDGGVSRLRLMGHLYRD